MSISDFAAVAGVVVTAGGILIYIGRQVGTLQSISDGVKVALAKTDRHDTEISELKVGLAQVQTRQNDCNNCP